MVQTILLLPVRALAATEMYSDFDVQDCWAATPLRLDAAHRVLASDGGDLFRLEVTSPGVLILEVAEAGYVPRRANVELVSKDCGPLRAENVTFIDRSLSRPVLKVNQPGVYYLRVDVGGEAFGQSYRLIVGFSEAVPIHPRVMAIKDVEEWQDDDETPEAGLPGAGSSPWGDLLLKDVEEWQDDDELPETGLPGAGSFLWGGSSLKEVEQWEPGAEFRGGVSVGAYIPTDRSSGVAKWTFDEPGILAVRASGSSVRAVFEPLSAFLVPPVSSGSQLGPSEELVAAVKPGSYLLHWVVSTSSCKPEFFFYPTCRPRRGDDHGDSRACATEVTLDSEVKGTIGADSAPDRDWFSFVLTQHARIHVQAFGDADVSVALLDAVGKPVPGHEGHWNEWGSGIDTELCPGRYFVKVEGIGLSSGRFLLATSMSPSWRVFSVGDHLHELAMPPTTSRSGTTTSLAAKTAQW